MASQLLTVTSSKPPQLQAPDDTSSSNNKDKPNLSSSTDHMMEEPLGPLNEDYKFFVANLPLGATVSDIRQHFETFGQVNFAKLIVNKQTGTSLGYGFVYMLDAQGDKRVWQYAQDSAFRIKILQEGVYLQRNDQRRVRPLHSRTSHDEGKIVYPATRKTSGRLFVDSGNFGRGDRGRGRSDMGGRSHSRNEIGHSYYSHGRGEFPTPNRGKQPFGREFPSSPGRRIPPSGRNTFLLRHEVPASGVRGIPQQGPLVGHGPSLGRGYSGQAFHKTLNANGRLLMEGESGSSLVPTPHAALQNQTFHQSRSIIGGGYEDNESVSFQNNNSSQQHFRTNPLETNSNHPYVASINLDGLSAGRGRGRNGFPGQSNGRNASIEDGRQYLGENRQEYYPVVSVNTNLSTSGFDGNMYYDGFGGGRLHNPGIAYPENNSVGYSQPSHSSNSQASPPTFTSTHSYFPQHQLEQHVEYENNISYQDFSGNAPCYAGSEGDYFNQGNIYSNSQAGVSAVQAVTDTAGHGSHRFSEIGYLDPSFIYDSPETSVAHSNQGFNNYQTSQNFNSSVPAMQQQQLQQQSLRVQLQPHVSSTSRVDIPHFSLGGRSVNMMRGGGGRGGRGFSGFHRRRDIPY